jgi:hypothetical protein
LRQYRDNLAYTLGDAAAILRCDRSKVSRIETGDRGIRGDELLKLLEAYGVPEDQQDVLLAIEESTRDPDSWWQDYVTLLSGAHLEYVATEPLATRILAYGPTVIPELLQSDGYARAVAAARPGISARTAETAGQAVHDRQAEILGQTTVPFSAVVGEAALQGHTSDEDLMREQLRHLADIAGTAWTTVQILPVAAGVPASGGCGSFSVITFDPVPFLGLVYLDGPGGGTSLETPAAISTYVDAFAQLQAASLSAEASLELIRRTAGD